MQDIKRVESWEIDRTKHKYENMFRGSSHCSTFPPSHRKISTMFTKNLPQRNLHWGITTYKQGVHNSNSHIPLHKRVGTKSREKYHLVITKITNNISDLKRSQTKYLSQYKILDDRFWMKNSSMWVNKVFKKENTKKILEKNFLIDEEIEEQKLDSQNLFSFDFSKLWNKIKICNLKLQNLFWKLVKNSVEGRNFGSWKSCWK